MGIENADEFRDLFQHEAMNEVGNILEKGIEYEEDEFQDSADISTNIKCLHSI